MNFSIISEYNPFHNGHNYQIQKLKTEFNCENLIVILSGNFVQRGDVAICSKFIRTKMALLSGVDLVLEIPQIFSTSSAMYFSKASISILDRLNIVDKICFGSENTDIDTLNKISHFLSDEPEQYRKNLQNLLKSGLSYPKARSIALKQFGFDETIDTPNNILAVEYIKALNEINSKIVPVTINRTNNFHDKSINNNIASATSIRENINNLELIKKTIPSNCSTDFFEDISLNRYNIDNLSNIFHHIFYSSSKSSILDVVDMNEHLYNRFIEVLKTTFLISDISKKMTTKNYTRTRISRIIINIILNNKQKDLNHFTNNGYPFVRVLGFKKEKQHLLKELEQKSDIKLITNLKNASKQLNSFELNLLEKDIIKTNYFLLSNENNSKNLDASKFENKLVIL